jgi:hypothetical protein
MTRPEHLAGFRKGSSGIVPYRIGRDDRPSRPSWPFVPRGEHRHVAAVAPDPVLRGDRAGPPDRGRGRAAGLAGAIARRQDADRAGRRPARRRRHPPAALRAGGRDRPAARRRPGARRRAGGRGPEHAAGHRGPPRRRRLHRRGHRPGREGAGLGRAGAPVPARLRAAVAPGGARRVGGRPAPGAVRARVRRGRPGRVHVGLRARAGGGRVLGRHRRAGAAEGRAGRP